MSDLPDLFPGFAARRVETTGGIEIHLRTGGSGPPRINTQTSRPTPAKAATAASPQRTALDLPAPGMANEPDGICVPAAASRARARERLARSVSARSAASRAPARAVSS